MSFLRKLERKLDDVVDEIESQARKMKKGTKDFFDFDEHAYRSKVENMKAIELQAEHALIRQKTMTSSAGVAVGVAAAATPIGLAGALVSGRRLDYNTDKLAILQRKLDEEGVEPVKLRKRDVAMALGPAVVTHGVLPGAEHTIHHFVNHAAGQGAARWTEHHVGETMSQAIHHTQAFEKGVEHGIETQVHAVGHALAGHHTDLVSVETVANHSANWAGESAGQAVAGWAETEGVNKGANWALGNTTTWAIGEVASYISSLDDHSKKDKSEDMMPEINISTSSVPTTSISAKTDSTKSIPKTRKTKPSESNKRRSTKKTGALGFVKKIKVSLNSTASVKTQAPSRYFVIRHFRRAITWDDPALHIFTVLPAYWLLYNGSSELKINTGFNSFVFFLPFPNISLLLGIQYVILSIASLEVSCFVSLCLLLCFPLCFKANGTAMGKTGWLSWAYCIVMSIAIGAGVVFAEECLVPSSQLWLKGHFAWTGMGLTGPACEMICWAKVVWACLVYIWSWILYTWRRVKSYTSR